MSILQDIFQDYYEEMLYILHPRQMLGDTLQSPLTANYFLPIPA